MWILSVFCKVVSKASLFFFFKFISSVEKVSLKFVWLGAVLLASLIYLWMHGLFWMQVSLSANCRPHDTCMIHDHSVLSFQPRFVVQILLWHVAIDRDPVFSYWVKGDCVMNTSCAFLSREALTSEFGNHFIESFLSMKKPRVYTIYPFVVWGLRL